MVGNDLLDRSEPNSTTREQFSQVFVALYRPDELARFTGHEIFMNLLVPRRDDQLVYETEMFLFGVDWLTHLLFDIP